MSVTRPATSARYQRDTSPTPSAPGPPRTSARAPWRPPQVRELPADASITVEELEQMAAAEVADIAAAVRTQNSADLMGRGHEIYGGRYGEAVDDFSVAPPISY